MVYLDTSVLAAYYCPEAMSAKAELAVRRCGEPAISWLVEVELSSAVARKVREGGLSRTDAVSTLARFRLHVDQDCYGRLPIEAMHYGLARDWLGLSVAPLRTLDALHLAVCFAAGAALLTADRDLARAARQFKVRTHLLSA